MTEDHDEATAAFLIEAGHLKRTKRAGWWIAGVKDPESVAEHSYRVGVIAYVLALMEGADPNRAATLGLFHDLPECRLGDVPSVGKPFVRLVAAEDVVTTQTERLPADVAGPIRELIGEFEAKETPEALCAKDADKIECLLQAREYIAQGHALAQPWADTMVGAVKTEAGRRLASAAMRVPVDQWWRAIVSSYGVQPPAE
jgi:putative hydrolase of HD superfamily